MVNPSARTQLTIDQSREIFAKKYQLTDLTDEEVLAVHKVWVKYTQLTGIPCAVAFVISFLTVIIMAQAGPDAFLPVVVPILAIGIVVGAPMLGIGNSKFKAYLGEFRKQHEASQQAAVAEEAHAENMRREQEATAQRQAAMETQSQREAKDKQRIETLKSLVEMSEEILIDDLAGVLELSRIDLLRKITEWGKKFAIKLKGDRVVIGREDVAGFVARLDQEMKDWGRTESTGAGKTG